MANLLDNKIEYTPLHYNEWFTKSLKGGVVIKNHYCRVIPNVTKSAILKTMVMDNNTISQVDERNCEWTPSQRITLDSKTSEVKNFKINEEQCYEELDSLFSEYAFQTEGAEKTDWPSGIEAAVMGLIQNSLSADIDRIFVGGSTNVVDGVQDGLLDKLAADSATIKVTGTTITTANVVAEIEKVYNAIPDAVLNMNYFEPEKAAVRIYVPIHVYRSLLQALGAVSGDHQVVLPNFTYVNGVVRYMNIEIAILPYLPQNSMLAYSVDNVFFLTDLLADTASVEVEGGKTLKDKNKVYINGKFRANSDYIFADEIVLYQ